MKIAPSRLALVAAGSVLIVAVSGWFAFRAQKPQPTAVPPPKTVPKSGTPKYTEITTEVVRTARVFDTYLGGEVAAEIAARYDPVEAGWASATFVPATSPISAIASALQSSVYDMDNVLTPAQREALLTKIAEYTHVRAQTTPDAYFELAAREPNLVWHDPETAYNLSSSKPLREHVAWIYKNYSDMPMDPAADTPKLLRDLWRPMMDTYGQRIAEVGYGERGAAIFIMRSHVPMFATKYGFADIYAQRHGQKGERWESERATYARPFRVPVQTNEDILKRDGVVLIAAAHIVTRLALSDEHIFVWQLFFYLDPDTNEWQCDSMGWTGTRNWQVMF